MHQLGDKLNNLRGVALTGYAQVDFHLADLILRASSLDCYKGLLTKRYFRKVDERIKIIQRLASVEGPISPYRNELESSVAHIKEFTALRNLMGHAMARLEVSPTAHVVHFEMYDTVAKGKLQLITERMSLDALSHQVDRLVLYTHTMLRLFAQIRDGLPQRISTSGPIPDE
jgi:hypothetical protein